jgi:hypothetical protein
VCPWNKCNPWSCGTSIMCVQGRISYKEKKNKIIFINCGTVCECRATSITIKFYVKIPGNKNECRKISQLLQKVQQILRTFQLRMRLQQMIKLILGQSNRICEREIKKRNALPFIRWKHIKHSTLLTSSGSSLTLLTNVRNYICVPMTHLICCNGNS